MGTGIGDVIRREAGRDVDLPEDDGRRWLRFPCPFCGKLRAAISYEIGLFKCFHADCDVKKLWVSRDDAETIRRFWLQIEQAVRNTKSKWGKWVSWSDLNQQARQFVIEYASSGLIDDWRYDLDGDETQVERYLLRELNCDLGNWLRKIVRRKRKEAQLASDTIGDLDVIIHRPQTASRHRPRDPIQEGLRRVSRPWQESPHNVVMWVSWPTLEMRYRFGMTDEQIAGELGVSVKTVRRRAASEMSDARDTYQERSLTGANDSMCGDRKFSRNFQIGVHFWPL